MRIDSSAISAKLAAVGARMRGGPLADIWNERNAVLAVLLLILGLTASLGFRLTDTPNHADARQNLVAAHNLVYRGTISMSGNGSPTAEPSNYREPLPILFMAAHIALHPALSSGHTIVSINEAPAVLAVKQHNLIWAFLCLLGVAFATMAAVRPRAVGFIAAALAVVLTYSFFLRRGSIIDRMMTEVQAGTLLSWSSFTLIRALQSGKAAWFAATGALIGALILTKAYFLFPAFGLILALLLLYLWRPLQSSRLRTTGLIAILVASIAIVTVPWVVRNSMQLGTFEITQRGGAVLLIRAYKNQMNDEEYAGAFYYYAPENLRPLFGRILGFSRSDLDLGGRLQRLNRGRSAFAETDLTAERAGRPQDAISFYRKARAERARVIDVYKSQGAENPVHLAERDLRDEALRMIAADPIRHLKTSVLYMWRGSRLFGLPLLIVAAVGLFRRDAELIGASLLPAGAVLFLSLTSHFLPRYAQPMVPAVVVTSVVLVTWLIVRIARARAAKLPRPAR